MSTLGYDALRKDYMRLSALGEISLIATPSAEDKDILNVSLGAENRKDVINMTTQKDETIDQFTLRVKGMMRALWNGEDRGIPPVILPDEKPKKAKTWPEQKAAMKPGVTP